MHKILFLTLASTLLFIPAHAQDFPQVWGELALSEIAIYEYDKDPLSS